MTVTTLAPGFSAEKSTAFAEKGNGPGVNEV